MLGVPTDHGDECKAEQNHDKDDFTTTEPELCLSIHLDSHDVEETTQVPIST